MNYKLRLDKFYCCEESKANGWVHFGLHVIKEREGRPPRVKILHEGVCWSVSDQESRMYCINNWIKFFEEYPYEETENMDRQCGWSCMKYE